MNLPTTCQRVMTELQHWQQKGKFGYKKVGNTAGGNGIFAYDRDN